MTVDDGYILQSSDYPEVPVKSGYVGSWNKYTSPIYGNIIITAVYRKGSISASGLPETDFSAEADTEVVQWELEAVEVENSAAAANTEATSLPERDGQRLVSTQTVSHEYLTISGRVAREIIKTDGTVTAVMDFIYDESGKPFALQYTNGTANPATYYYVLNLQGDVLGLINASGTIVARYTYNAWGEILTATGTMAEINPLRYRGYYYDTETGFYYLQSRYYDPVTHRFINADSLASTGQGFTGTNMFAYCNNNPVNAFDPSGSISINLPYQFFMLAMDDSKTEYVFTEEDEAGQEIGRAIQQSKAMRDLVLENMPQYSSRFDGSYTGYTKFDPYPYMASSDPDWALSYSIGEAIIVMTYNIIPYKNTYTVLVNYVISDTYTFERWDKSKGTSFTRYINNTAFGMMESDMLSSYSWTCAGSYLCPPEAIQDYIGGIS